MRVFVTGATGFDGSAIAQPLRADGHDVYGLARTPDAEQLLRHNGIHAVEGDLDDRLTDALAAANAADATVFAAQIPPDREGSVRHHITRGACAGNMVTVRGEGGGRD